MHKVELYPFEWTVILRERHNRGNADALSCCPDNGIELPLKMICFVISALQGSVFLMFHGNSAHKSAKNALKHAQQICYWPFVASGARDVSCNMLDAIQHLIMGHHWEP